jgi:DNA recombination protein RmuC
MDLVIAVVTLAGCLVALALGYRVGRSHASHQVAGLITERQLLRERVTDLEAALGQDQEVAATLGPISVSLQRVEAQVRTLERDHVAQTATLDAQLRSISASGEALRVQTGALAGALRSSTARGAWGEMQLRRVVEHAGMLDHVDFDVQVTTTTEDGAAVRPDMVVHLPGGKHLVVDAKAPLAALLLAAETPDDPARQAESARAHARAVRAHVDALAAKRYWTAFAPGPDLVVCFLPGESVLAAACTADPSLLDHALGRRVVLATPTTLLTLMRSAAMGWQSEALSGNARELLQLGRDLHERLGTMGGHTERLGRSLAKAVEDYNAFVGTLERRVLVTARRLRELDLGEEELPAPPRLAALPRRVSATELS